MIYRALFIAALLAATLAAQINLFPTRAYFHEQWTKPPLEVELRPPIRLEDYVASGKLELSLRSCIDLVMANNTDVAIQRLTVVTAQDAIERAFAPFDPSFLGSFSSSRANTPSNDLLAGASVLSSLAQQASFAYTQTMENGTQYSVGFLGTKNGNNSAFTSFNPNINTNLQVSVTQPLIRNRGAYINRIPIMIARSQYRANDADLRTRIIDLLSQAENAYWDVISARETLKVRRKSLELAEAFLKLNRRELELGAISPLDIYQPEQQEATAQLQVTQALYQLKQREDVLRKWIGADLHPEIRRLPLELTETVLPPSESQVIDEQEELAEALRVRPELDRSRYTTDAADLQIQAATNQLRPDLRLGGNYISQGHGGNFFQRSLLGATTASLLTPGGFTDAVDQLFGFGFPVYGFSLTLRLPLRNRQAAADLADAAVNKKREMLNLRNLEQQIRLQVLNAIAGVEQSRASVKQAALARDFSQKRLEAEQKKFELGAREAFFVLQAQIDLATAESDLLSQEIGYRRNLLALLQANGTLLEERGVVVQ
ncbi:MAG TPA: TolC family protein [Bryobacterales bacterium]|nr:TolC family protein [Bryobacterales bacterium]